MESKGKDDVRVLVELERASYGLANHRFVPPDGVFRRAARGHVTGRVARPPPGRAQILVWGKGFGHFLKG